MTPDDLTGLTNVLLTAGAAGAVLAFAYLARQRIRHSDKVRLWVGAALVAIPGLLLGWVVTRPQLGVTAAYGEFTEAILGTTPVIDARPAPRPVVGRTPAPDVGGAAAGRPSDASTTAPVTQAAQSPQPTDPTQTTSPSVTASVTPTTSPSPSPSDTPTPSTTPSPSGTPTPTPTPSPSPDSDDAGDTSRDDAQPPPAPEPSET